jgi:hypothetical protein
LEQIASRPLGQLRLRVSGRPEQVGALALAHGSDLHWAAHAPHPDSDAGRWLLVHELVHLLQQAQTPREGGGQVLVDPHAEAQADALASLAVRHPERGREAIRRAFDPSIVPVTLAPDRGVMQPNVHMKMDGKDTKLKDANAAFNQMYSGVKDAPTKNRLTQHKAAVTAVLTTWIRSSRRLIKRFFSGSHEHTVAYNSWEELARALLGEVLSQPNLEKETKLAKLTKDSAYVFNTLVAYLKFVNETVHKDGYKAELKVLFPTVGWFRGKYSHWLPISGVKKCLTEPEKMTFTQLVAGIHDLAEGLGEVGDHYGEVPNIKCVSTVLVPTEQGYSKVKTHLLDNRQNLRFREGYLGSRDCTLKEKNDIVVAARDHNMPLEFGPSFTTGRTLQACFELCRSQGKDAKAFMTCIAWGLFAFWNQDYEKKYSRGHRWHEVMDMALNYGVDYEPYSYPALPPTQEDPNPVGAPV